MNASASPNARNSVMQKDQLLRLMRMNLLVAEPGYAKVTMPLWDGILNGMGMAHGGAIFALADIAFGAAANAGSDNTHVVSLATSIDFLRAGRIGPFTAEAHVIRAGRNIVNYDVQVFDGEQKLIARTAASGYVLRQA